MKHRLLKVFSPVVMLLLTAPFLCGGCASREHMSPEYGRQTREFHARQQVYAEAEKEAQKGLDSEEAALVHGNYRKNLAGGSTPKTDPGSKVLVIEDDNRNGKR